MSPGCRVGISWTWEKKRGRAVQLGATSVSEQHATCDIHADAGDGILVITASGAITIRTIGALQRSLSEKLREVVTRKGFGDACINMSGVGVLDTAGAWLVHKTATELERAGMRVLYDSVRPEHRSLLDEIASGLLERHPPAKKPSIFASAYAGLNRVAGAAGSQALDIVAYFGLFVTALGRLLLAPRRMRLTAFVHHLDHAGLRAAPIIALICFLIGAVIMQQAALQLSYYGAEVYSVSMLGMLALREVGVLLTVVMVAGRSASAFTAEIGSMKMREEIAAMQTIGIDPVETLIVPRILALLVAVPLLTFLGDVMCLAGGAVVAVFHLGQDLPSYLARLEESIELRHFMAGMIKTPFAAILIGIIGCSEGMKVAGSAESLGQHVTSAVVKAIFIVIICGAALSMFLASIGS